MSSKEQLKAALEAKDVQLETQKREREERLEVERQRAMAHTEQYVKAVGKLNEQIAKWVEGLDFQITSQNRHLSDGPENYDAIGLILIRRSQFLSFIPKGKSTGEYLGSITLQPKEARQRGSLSLQLASINSDGSGSWFLVASVNGDSNEFPFDDKRFYDLLKTTFA